MSDGDFDLVFRAKDGRGIPLSMAGYLMRAVGTAYPATQIVSGVGELVLRIAATDYMEDVTDEDLAALAPEKDDPQTVAFTNGFRDGSFGVSPPPWLSVLLQETADSLVDALPDAAENYLQVELQSIDPTKPPFAWIICRPGGASPHDKRVEAEARLAAVAALVKGKSGKVALDVRDLLEVSS